MSSSLPSPTYFSALDVNTATDTLCSTLTSCLDHICPLSSRPARAAPSNSWLSGVLRAAERKWCKSKDPSTLYFLSRPLSFSRLDYCNALLAGLPSCTIKPLQMIQKAAARQVFSEPKRAHVWLPVAALIKFQDTDACI